MVGIVITILHTNGFEPNQVRHALPTVFGRRPRSRKWNRIGTGPEILNGWLLFTFVLHKVGIVITILHTNGFEPNQVHHTLPTVFGRRPCSRKRNRIGTGPEILNGWLLFTFVLHKVGIVITILPADGFEPNQVRRALPTVFGRCLCSRKWNRIGTGWAILR